MTETSETPIEQSKSYYSVLGIEPSATPEEVRKAFRTSILKNHPDRNENSEESQAITILLQEAYAVLGDPDKRKSYDAHLASLRRREARGTASAADAWRFNPEGTVQAPRNAQGSIVVEAQPDALRTSFLRTYWYAIPLLVVVIIVVFSVANYNAFPKNNLLAETADTSHGIMPSTSADSMNHVYKGEILEDDGSEDEAVSEYRSAVALDPTNLEAHKHLARAMYEDGLIGPALVEYRALIKMDPNDADAHNGLANVLVMQEQPAEAIVELQNAIRLDPSSPEYFDNLGSIYYNQQQYQNAADQFRDAIKLKPDDTETICDLGTTLSDAGNYPAGILEYRAALAIDPNCKEAQLGLGKDLYLSGQKLAGQVELSSVLKMNAKDTTQFIKDTVAENNPSTPLAQ